MNCNPESGSRDGGDGGSRVDGVEKREGVRRQKDLWGRKDSRETVATASSPLSLSLFSLLSLFVIHCDHLTHPFSFPAIDQPADEEHV